MVLVERGKGVELDGMDNVGVGGKTEKHIQMKREEAMRDRRTGQVRDRDRRTDMDLDTGTNMLNFRT